MKRLPVCLDDVRAAAAWIAPHVHRTPVLTSRTADAVAGARLFFKCETFQRVGAFKARGAFSRLTLLSSEERRRGVVRQLQRTRNGQQVVTLRVLQAQHTMASGRILRRRRRQTRRSTSGLARCFSNTTENASGNRTGSAVVLAGCLR